MPGDDTPNQPSETEGSVFPEGPRMLQFMYYAGALQCNKVPIMQHLHHRIQMGNRSLCTGNVQSVIDTSLIELYYKFLPVLSNAF
jgi:hypothetical protein